MSLYILFNFIFIFLVVLAFIDRQGRSIFFASLILVFIIGSRTVSPDLLNYELYFEHIKNGDNLSDTRFLFEPGYMLLNKLLSIFFNFNSFILVVTAIAILLKVISFNKLVDEPYVLLFIYVGLDFFDKEYATIRNSLSLSVFIFFSIRYFLSESWGKYFLSIIFASFFHVSSLLYLLLPILRYINISRKNFLFCFITCLCAILLVKVVFFKIFIYLPFIGDKISHYSTLDATSQVSLKSFFPLIIVYLCADVRNKLAKLAVATVLVGVSIRFSFFDYAGIGRRLYGNLYIFEAILFYFAYKLIKPRPVFKLVLITYLIFSLNMYIARSFSAENMEVGYQSWIFKS